jgi:hypothetical protein
MMWKETAMPLALKTSPARRVDELTMIDVSYE